MRGNLSRFVPGDGFAAFSTFLSSVTVVLKKSSLSFWTVLLVAARAAM